MGSRVLCPLHLGAAPVTSCSWLLNLSFPILEKGAVRGSLVRRRAQRTGSSCCVCGGRGRAAPGGQAEWALAGRRGRRPCPLFAVSLAGRCPPLRADAGVAPLTPQARPWGRRAQTLPCEDSWPRPRGPPTSPPSTGRCPPAASSRSCTGRWPPSTARTGEARATGEACPTGRPPGSHVHLHFLLGSAVVCSWSWWPHPGRGQAGGMPRGTLCSPRGSWCGAGTSPARLTGEAARASVRPGRGWRWPPALTGTVERGGAGCGRRSRGWRRIGRKVVDQTPSSQLGLGAVWPRVSPPFPTARSRRPRASDSKLRAPPTPVRGVPSCTTRGRVRPAHGRPSWSCGVSRRRARGVTRHLPAQLPRQGR